MLKNIEAVVGKAIQIAIKYEKLTGRKLGITGEIGEVLASNKLNLTLLPDPLSAGFDAFDINQKRYQIKSKRIIKTEGRLGSFSKHPFDFAVMILFDKSYNVTEIRKATYRRVKKIILKHKKRNPSIREFRKNSDSV